MRKWPTATLQELADIRVSNVDKKSLHGETPVRLCNYMDAYGNDYIHAGLPFMEATATIAEISRFKVDKGDVLITKDSETPFDIGIPAVVVDDIDNLVCGYHLALLKPNRDLVDPVFLCKQLGTPAVASYFSRYAAGSTRYGLSNRAVANTQIPLPSLLQQRKVAAVLTCIDAAIEKTEALIEKYQQIKAGLMHDLFTRGVLSNGQLRPPREQAPELYRETTIGWIPKDWDFVRVETLCSDIADCPHSTPIYETSGIPCIRTADMLPGELLLDDAFRVGEKTYRDRVERLTPRTGDIIYSREGERLGIASPVGAERVCLGQRVMLLRADPSASHEFLMWAMNMPNFYRQVLKGLGATTSPHVNVGDIKRLYVPKPSIQEQRTIGSLIGKSHTNLSTELVLKGKLVHQKLGLMQDLLTGRVPVKVEAGTTETEMVA